VYRTSIAKPPLVLQLVVNIRLHFLKATLSLSRNDVQGGFRQMNRGRPDLPEFFKLNRDMDPWYHQMLLLGEFITNKRVKQGHRLWVAIDVLCLVLKMPRLLCTQMRL
jgi:hypothetical protein